MIENYFTKNVVACDVDAQTPEEVIRSVGNLLVQANKVDDSYVDAMIDVYHTLGAYIVLAPGIAFPHAKPGPYVKEPCVAFCNLRHPVKFNHKENDPVKMVFALGGYDETCHMGLLQSLFTLLMDCEKLQQLETVKNYDEFLEVIKKGGEE